MQQFEKDPHGTKLADPRAKRLHDEHTSIGRELEDLANRAETGDWSLCDSIWDGFTARLEDHMQFEETSLLDDFAASSAEARGTAKELRDEHARIRASLLDLGVLLQLHQLSRNAIESLVAVIRDHARRENLTLYPWADEARSRKG
jgi:hemerythrin-like domain-containing protein